MGRERWGGRDGEGVMGGSDEEMGRWGDGEMGRWGGERRGDIQDGEYLVSKSRLLGVLCQHLHLT